MSTPLSPQSPDIQVPGKDPKRITPGMYKNKDCPCRESESECVYRGYCELCKEYHGNEPVRITQDMTEQIHCAFCRLPPGKDKYFIPWVEGTNQHTVYSAIKPVPKDIEKKEECPCNTDCVYKGYCEICRQHIEKYQACTCLLLATA